MDNPKVKSGSGTTSPTVPELISELRSSFFASDFQNLAKKFTEHEELMTKKYNQLKKKSEEEKRLLISEKLKLNNDLKKKETEIEALKKQNDECEEKTRVYKNLMMGLEKKVKVLEEAVEQCKGNQPQKTALVGVTESSRPVLSSEKGDSTKRTETQFKEIIQIISDDDDDVDDDQHIGTLKRKRFSTSKRASKKIKIESNSNDYVDNNLAGAQKRKNFDESHRQPITSPVMEKIDEVYKSVAAKLKKQKEWKFEADMVLDFEKDDDLCLAAVCALRRQKKAVHGSDISSFARLAQLLMDGNLQNKPQKKAAELDPSDLKDCRVFARKYSYQIFNICQEKNDPFFPP